jgi:hypothetical protein
MGSEFDVSPAFFICFPPTRFVFFRHENSG